MGMILCITGRSAVGKSTVSKVLAADHELPCFGFGSHQRKLLGTNPSNLSVVRERYIELWPKHLETISSCISDRGMILEGIYNVSFLEMLRDSFPEHTLRLIALRASKRDRLSFYSSRNDRVDEKDIKSLGDLDEVKKKIGLVDVFRKVEKTYVNVYGDIESCVRIIKRDYGSIYGN